MDVQSIAGFAILYFLIGLFIAGVAHDAHWANNEQILGIGLFWPLAILLLASVGFVRWAWDIIRGL